MADAASLIHDARLPEREYPLCLRPDLVREYESVQRQIRDAQEERKVADSLVATADTTELEARLVELEEQMRASTIVIVFRALPRPRFRALWAAHPPRKDDDNNVLRDDVIGVNTSTFWPILVRESAISPELDEATWSLLLDERITDRQFFDLANSAFDLCQERVDLPFSFTA